MIMINSNPEENIETGEAALEVERIEFVSVQAKQTKDGVLEYVAESFKLIKEPKI